MQKFIFSSILVLAFIFSASSQCYEIGFNEPPNLDQDANNYPNVIMNLEFCNFQDEVPNDPNDNSRITLCGPIVISWQFTGQSSEEPLEYCLNINLQPSGIIAGNGCHDVMNDNISNCGEFVTAVADDILMEDNVLFSPNPTSDSILVSTNFAGLNVEVFDLQGKSIASHVIQNDGTINTRNLAVGAYIFKLVDAKGAVLVSEKIIVAR